MLNDDELLEVEAAVAVACAASSPGRLRLLGNGEISIVLGWPVEAPVVAVKRLPPFPDGASFERYADVVARYVARLRDAGVAVLPTEVRGVRRADGRTVGFHLQPVVEAGSIATEWLRSSAPGADDPIVVAVVDSVARATTGGVGVDAQLANWAVVDGVPTQLDLTTPFLTDESGRLGFDLAPFLASLPSAVRPVVAREMRPLVQRWLTVRGSLLDLVANLYKEGLDDWVEPVLGVVNQRVDPPITAEEARRTHRSDRRLWPLLLRLQRGERWWSTTVRRRPYEFLLPAHTTYGR